MYVGRPTIFGNPFKIEACIDAGFATSEDHATRVCVDAFRDWLAGDDWAAGSSPDWLKRRKMIIDGLPGIAGKDLVCWCPLDQPCHPRS